MNEQKRVNSGRPGSNTSGTGRHSVAGSVKNDADSTVRNLASREEEYKKLNAELEAKTANLVKEAEDVLKGQDSILNEPKLLEKINTDEFLKSIAMKRRRNSTVSTQPCSIQESKIFWARVPGMEILWPAKLVKVHKKEYVVYIKSDNENFCLKKSEASLVPFIDHVSVLKTEGLDEMLTVVVTQQVDEKLRDYNRRCSGTDGSHLLGSCSELEKKLLESQEVMTIRGKVGRAVPVILPDDVKPGLRYLADSSVRASVGDSIVWAYDSVRKAAYSAQLGNPEAITSTNLRKYMATVTQVLDLTDSQMQWVTNHLGHTLDVHKLHYRAFDDDYVSANENRSSSSQSKPSSARVHSAVKSTNESRAQSRNQSRNNQTQSAGKKPTSAKARLKSGRSNIEDVAVVDDTFLTEYKDFSLQNVVDNMEGLDLSEDDIKDDVIPTAAQDMGSEAQIRFLKAKLRVMQEEMDRLGEEISKKEEENSQLSVRVKELEDERGRLTRTNAAQTQQIDKFKKIAEDSKTKTDGLETQLTSTRKELDQLKRNHKQQCTTQSATEVRLNRALEEIEKYKEQLSRSKTSSRETTEQEKRRVEQLLAENKRLEKQKNELMAGFKKQLKLIDILKRQKMHVEAAKMLAFSEEEFVKALEWGS